MSKRLGGIISCSKHKNSSCHLIGFPNGSDIGSTVSCQGETHRYTVYLNFFMSMNASDTRDRNNCYIVVRFGVLAISALTRSDPPKPNY